MGRCYPRDSREECYAAARGRGKVWEAVETLPSFQNFAERIFVLFFSAKTSPSERFGSDRTRAGMTKALPPTSGTIRCEWDDCGEEFDAQDGQKLYEHLTGVHIGRKAAGTLVSRRSPSTTRCAGFSADEWRERS